MIFDLVVLVDGRKVAAKVDGDNNWTVPGDRGLADRFRALAAARYRDHGDPFYMPYGSEQRYASCLQDALPGTIITGPSPLPPPPRGAVN